jgi:uncharacterized membrane protein YidH (DUF202 family)
VTGFERWSVWITTALVTVTGIALGWMEYLLEPVDPWAVVHHPLQPLVLKLHIVTAPLLVFAIGMIAIRHVWRHFRSGTPRGRVSGVTAALSAVPMVVSGYLVQVITDAGWLLAVALGHLALGVLYVGGLLVHQAVLRGRPDPEPERPTALPARRARAPRTVPPRAAGGGRRPSPGP